MVQESPRRHQLTRLPQVREGFIVDEDEEEEVDGDAVERKRKRARRDRAVEERLDEDDLDLIGEQPGWDRQPTEV
ncbi:hypothetical protein IMZ48_09315 [Candidatus Bathyarchaeota archaeon]|nr:hypothetical protein [Candidatus Bathyarchaeota archaeon]